MRKLIKEKIDPIWKKKNKKGGKRNAHSYIKLKWSMISWRWIIKDKPKLAFRWITAVQQGRAGIDSPLYFYILNLIYQWRGQKRFIMGSSVGARNNCIKPYLLCSITNLSASFIQKAIWTWKIFVNEKHLHIWKQKLGNLAYIQPYWFNWQKNRDGLESKSMTKLHLTNNALVL